jgi:hypothetical protein
MYSLEEMLEDANDRIAELEKLLRDLDAHFKLLDENGVHVWPNHPLNPRKRIADALRASD